MRGRRLVLRRSYLRRGLLAGLLLVRHLLAVGRHCVLVRRHRHFLRRRSSSPAAAGSGSTGSGSVRSPASARSDLEVEVSPVAEMPAPSAIEPVVRVRSQWNLLSGSLRSRSGLILVCRIGLHATRLCLARGCLRRGSCALRQDCRPGQLVRLSSGSQLRFGDCVSY